MRHLDRRRFLRTAAGSLVPVGTGCSAPVSEPERTIETEPGWSTFRGDRYNTGYAPGVSDLDGQPLGKWNFEAEGAFWGSPIVANGTVYAGSADNTLYAVDAETGQLEWEFSAADRLEATPEYADNTVYVGSYDRHIYALEADTGEKRWELETDGLIRGSAKAVDDAVYIGVGCHNLACDWYGNNPPESGWIYSIDAETGDPNWKFEPENEVVSTPAVDQDTVYIGSSDGNLYALERSSGEEQWRYETRDWIWTAPTLAFGTVFFADWDAKIHAVDAATGQRQWTYNSHGAYISGSTAVDEEAVYFGYTPPNAAPNPNRKNAKVFALERETGFERWEHLTEALEIGSSPVVTEDSIYIGSHSQFDESGTGIYALTKEGKRRWFFEVKQRGVGTSPALMDGVLYFGAADNRLYALE